MTKTKDAPIRGHYIKHKPLVCPHCGEKVRRDYVKQKPAHARCKNCSILMHPGQVCDCMDEKNYYHPEIYYLNN